MGGISKCQYKGCENGKICRDSMAAVLALVPSVVKAGFICRAGHYEPFLFMLCGYYW